MPHVRCRNCEARRTLARHPDHYGLNRAPRCKTCGKRDYRRDKYRDTVELKVKPCRCGGYSFPHAAGRGWCLNNPRWTADDMEKWYEENRRT